MSLVTNGNTAAGGVARHSDDFKQLRHAREQHHGFPVGRYLQPPPMLFSRDGHNIFLGDMFRGHPCFLIAGGPSLTTHDLSRLDQRGVLTCAVNNAAAVYRPRLWVSADDPGNFCDAIWNDAGIFKFVPLCHMEKKFTVRNSEGVLVPSERLVGDSPAVFGFRRNEDFQPQQWLFEDTFNWGNHTDSVDADGHKGSRSVMYIALRLLFYLGVRKVFLLGCDFRMKAGRPNYAFEQARSPASIRGNNSSYQIMNSRFARLLPHFEAEGYEVFNCTESSGLTVFPHLKFDDAVAHCTAGIPQNIVTSGMYDRKTDDVIRTQGALANPTPSSTIADVPQLTLITAVDANSLPTLEQTWLTWMRFRPELRTTPVIIICDEKSEKRLRLSTICSHPNVTLAPCVPGPSDLGRARWSLSLLQVASRMVETPWYLKLDPEAVAVADKPWIVPDWFSRSNHIEPPVYVSSAWGYVKPAWQLKLLDEWGDTVEGLKEFAPLSLPFDSNEDRVRVPTLSSWCFFGDVEWTREISRYVCDTMPCNSFGTFHFYCAARRHRRGVRCQMKDLGWSHSFGRPELALRRAVAALKDGHIEAATPGSEGLCANTDTPGI